MSSMMYYHQLQQQENPSTLNYIMPQTQAHIVVFEEYCTNPTCHCEEVLLDFAQLKEEAVTPLFKIRLSLQTWQVVEDASLPRHISNFEAKAICTQFLLGLPSVRHLFQEHYQEAKQFGQANLIYPDHIQAAIRQGQVIRYRDTAETEEIFHRHQGQVYYLEDSYCTDHSCHCHEMHITLYLLNEQQEQQLPLCTARIDLDQPDQFHIRSGQVTPAFLLPFLQSLWHNQPELLVTFRQRANQLKHLAVPTAKTEIGRNDPCPCGSGKKYKKCCGK